VEPNAGAYSNRTTSGSNSSNSSKPAQINSINEHNKYNTPNNNSGSNNSNTSKSKPQSPPFVDYIVTAKPNSRESTVTEEGGGVLAVALAAPPVDGRANRELLDTLAEHFGVSKSKVELLKGMGTRHKRVRVHFT
jgi:hypothetical protein